MNCLFFLFVSTTLNTYCVSVILSTVWEKVYHIVKKKSDLEIIAVGASFVSEHLSIKRLCDSEGLK